MPGGPEPVATRCTTSTSTCHPEGGWAIVGPSGSGKSTLLAGLLRFCPTTGDVRLGAVQLDAVPEETLRRTVGLAAADAHIFDSTLAANLRLAKPDAPDGELRSALGRAGLLGWAWSLPRGLDTPVGEHGRNLSGGQRQRLALARALLADVPVLLCDEPDASFDPANADRLVADLLAAAGDRGVVIVTHRLSSVAGVDEVLVLDGGRVTARGNHAELMATPGWYRQRLHDHADATIAAA
jgi:ABC-type multidrug transport system fused ATPase/permease subunit